MISTTKVLCFVAIAFADSDFQTDHDAVMRELSGGEPEGLDTIEQFRELVGDTDEFRELADAIADEDREVLWKKFRKWFIESGGGLKNRELADASAEVRELADAIADEGERETGWKIKLFRKFAKKLRKFSRKHRQLDEDAEEREAFIHALFKTGRAAKNKWFSRQLDDDEEAFAAVLV